MVEDDDEEDYDVVWLFFVGVVLELLKAVVSNFGLWALLHIRILRRSTTVNRYQVFRLLPPALPFWIHILVFNRFIPLGIGTRDITKLSYKFPDDRCRLKESEPCRPGGGTKVSDCHQRKMEGPGIAFSRLQQGGRSV